MAVRRDTLRVGLRPLAALRILVCEQRKAHGDDGYKRLAFHYALTYGREYTSADVDEARRMYPHHASAS